MQNVYSPCYCSAVPKGRPSELIQLTDRTSVCDFTVSHNSTLYLFYWGSEQVTQCISQLLIYPSTQRNSILLCYQHFALIIDVTYCTFFILHVALRTCRFMHTYKVPLLHFFQKILRKSFLCKAVNKSTTTVHACTTRAKNLKNTSREKKFSLCNQ